MEVSHGLYSPRLRLLAQELQTRDTAALARFWQDITQHGTPLVEQLDEG